VVIELEKVIAIVVDVVAEYNINSPA